MNLKFKRSLLELAKEKNLSKLNLSVAQTYYKDLELTIKGAVQARINLQVANTGDPDSITFKRVDK